LLKKFDAETSAPRVKSTPVSDFSHDRPGRYDNLLFWLTAVAATLGGFFVLYFPFVTGERHVFHDNLIPATLYGMFYDRLFSADSILWSSALNGGHPLWVSFGAYPIVDPAAFLVYSAAAILGADWFTAYHVTTLLWAAAWAAGGALCATSLSRNRWAALLVFVILFFGPFSLAFPAQGQGFLIPFRYFSVLIYLYFVLRQEVSTRRVLYFTTCLAFALSSYNSVLPFIALSALVAVEFLLDAGGYVSWARQLFTGGRIWFFSIPFLAFGSTIAWFVYTQWFVGITRLYGRSNIYFLELEDLAGDLFLSYLDILDPEVELSVYHGTGFLGFMAIPFFILGMRRGVLQILMMARPGARSAPAIQPSAALIPWLALILAIACGAFGLREFIEAKGSLFEYRNFGYLFPLVYLLMALITAVGFSDLMAGRCTWPGIGADCLIFLVCVAIAYSMRQGSIAFSGDLIALSLVFAATAFLWWIVCARYPLLWFAAPAIIVVSVELLFFARLVPSLESLAIQEGAEAAVAHSRARIPRFLSGRETLPANRMFEFPVAEHWPIHFDGPAVFHKASAYTRPVLDTPIGTFGNEYTQFFRLRTYHDLVSKANNRETMREILGVNRPILEIVPESDFERAADGLLFVLRSAGGTRGGQMDEPESAAELPGGPVSPAGEILDVVYEGDSVLVKLRVLQEAVLIYRDNAAPGWSVRVDGQPADLLLVDRVNKATALAAGDHEVQFLYRPWAYLVTFVLRAVVLGLGGLACLRLWYGSCRRVGAH
jgi:hypothetical protein